MAIDLFGDFGVVGPANATASRFQDAQTCVNWYPEISASKRAKEVVALLGAPGLVQVAAAPGGGAPGFTPAMTAWPQPSAVTDLPVRALWVLPGETQALAVIADTLYLVGITTYGSRDTPGALTLTNVGTLSTSTGPVKIRDNGVQGGTALIVDGQYGYTYQWGSNIFEKIVDPNFLGAGALAFIDGWFALSSPYPQEATQVAKIALTSGTGTAGEAQINGYYSGVCGVLTSSTTVGTVTGFYTQYGSPHSPFGLWTILSIEVGADPTQAYFNSIQGPLGTLNATDAAYTYAGGVATWSWANSALFPSSTVGNAYTFALMASTNAQFYTPQSPYSTSWNASYYAFKDGFSDELVALVEMKELLWLIGEQTSEPWYDAGGQYFPFQRLSGALIQVGCKAPYSIARITAAGSQDALIWLGRSDRGENIVVLLSGLQYQVVSTPAISDAVAGYVTTSDAIGYTYQEDGHEFYLLTFPTADVTWCYDASMPLEFAWTRRASYDPYAAAMHRHRGNCFMNFAGMRVIGDYENGALYQLTRAAQNDAGWPLLARRRTPHVWHKESRQRVFLSSLQLDFAPGQGAASGLGANPQAQLRISRDGGATYGQPQLAPMGAMGQYLNRCMWRRLGWSRDAVAELEVIAPVNRDLIGATLKAFGES